MARIETRVFTTKLLILMTIRHYGLDYSLPLDEQTHSDSLHLNHLPMFAKRVPVVPYRKSRIIAKGVRQTYYSSD